MAPDALEIFRRSLDGLLGRDLRPVVVYTACWPLARHFPVPPGDLPETLLDALLEAVGPNRTLLMPVFTKGFQNGLIDLDGSPGTTGMINERFRRLPGARRTVSAFFSFAARGPDAESLAALRPADAWGDGSLYEWIERRNARLVMLGMPWAYCSFLHRVEWIVRVPYRYVKSFTGEVIHEGRRMNLTERLFVRSLDPPAFNVWPGLDDLLARSGMRSHPLGAARVSAVDAESLVSVIGSVVQSNPYAFVRSPERLRAAFSDSAREAACVRD